MKTDIESTELSNPITYKFSNVIYAVWLAVVFLNLNQNSTVSWFEAWTKNWLCRGWLIRKRLFGMGAHAKPSHIVIVELKVPNLLGFLKSIVTGLGTFVW